MVRKHRRTSLTDRSSSAIQSAGAGGSVLSWLPIFMIGAILGVTILYVWSKVELATLAREISTAEATLEAIAEEKSSLAASITVETKPGLIQERARQQLGMVYAPHGYELVVRGL
jgi:cell division protein FtsL